METVSAIVEEVTAGTQAMSYQVNEVSDATHPAAYPRQSLYKLIVQFQLS